MTFNILEGGIDGAGLRIDFIIDVIKEVQPDFLALQEANNFDKDDNALLKKVSSEIDLPYHALSSGSIRESGKRYHVVSLSRFPLREIHTFSNFLFKCAVLSVIIDSPLGELSICNLHLDVNSRDSRVREARAVLDYQSKFKKSVILGDFNSLSHFDHYEDLSAEEFTTYDLTSYTTTDLFNKDYVDSVARLNVNDRRTHPTIGVGHPISKSPIRIDYIFVTPSLTTHLKSATVIKTSTSEKASDHYPVALTLQ